MKAIAHISETAELDGTRRISFFDEKTNTPLSHAFVTDEWIAKNHPVEKDAHDKSWAMEFLKPERTNGGDGYGRIVNGKIHGRQTT